MWKKVTDEYVISLKNQELSWGLGKKQLLTFAMQDMGARFKLQASCGSCSKVSNSLLKGIVGAKTLGGL